MIAFALYLVLILWLIYHYGLFGLFTDPTISRTKFTLFFFLKALAVPAFYFVYKKMYGGIEGFDAGKFYADAAVISDYGREDPSAYIRLMFGMQDDNAGSYDFVNYLNKANNWDNGQLKDYLYNDNRVVIRFHSFIHFIAFKSYFVHALFNCLLSYIGVVFLYKSLREYFQGKELFVLCILCFFPALWFYAGAVLKEGITLFVLGCQVYTIKKLIGGKYSITSIVWFVFLLFVSFLLKPYILLFCTLCFVLFFGLQKQEKIKRKTLAFYISLFVLILLVNLGSMLVKGKSFVKAINDHQRVFADMSKGGIFLIDSVKFVRLEDDMALVKKVEGRDSIYSIRKNSAYMYREHSHQDDTLYCKSNMDTVSTYKLMYFIAESNSNIDPDIYKKGILVTLGASLYYSLLYPFFINAHGALRLLASFENLLILVSLIVFLIGIVRRKKNNFLPLLFITMTLLTCILIGIATPNSGAIFRYRSVVVIFILLAALYYLPAGQPKPPKEL